MIHLAPRSTRTDYLLPYTTHFRSPHRRQTPSAPRDHTPRPCRRAAEYQWMSYGSSPVCCGSPRQGHGSASSSNRLETWWRFHSSTSSSSVGLFASRLAVVGYESHRPPFHHATCSSSVARSRFLTANRTAERREGKAFVSSCKS